MKISKIADGVNIIPMLWALQKNPHLWNADLMRTKDPESPHHEVDDIWVRYSKVAELHGPHESSWYPAAEVLPVRDIIYPLMQFVKGEQLGGVLITRIPAGKSCKPHHDNGWHAQYYQKFCVQIQSAPGQEFCFEDERLEARPGDVYGFRNEFVHWVTNPGEYDRISMICCIKTDWEWWK